jgi:hypothetical protein
MDHGEAQPVNDIVQARFKNGKQVLALLSRFLYRHIKITSELAFQKAVVPFRLLFFSELQAILRGLVPTLTVLSGRVCAPVYSAFFRITSVAFQEEFLAFSAAKAANGIGISCHNRTS